MIKRMLRPWHLRSKLESKLGWNPGSKLISSPGSKQQANLAPHLRLFVTLAAIFLITACNPRAIPTVIFPARPETENSAPAKQTAITKTISIRASETANPDLQGRPSPLQVRIFLHSDPAQIESASFEQLFEFGNLTSISDPLFVKILKPGSEERFDISIEPQHKVLAIAAAYRDIGRAKWLHTIAIDDPGKLSTDFILTEYSVDLANQ